MKSITITGSSVKVYINSRPFGVCTGFEYTVDYGRKSLGGLDFVSTFEIIPGSVKVSGKLECTRLGGYGGLEGTNIVASEDNLTLEKYISIVLVDRKSNAVIFKSLEALVINQSWSVTPRGVMKGTFSFEGLSWSNESEF
jgi:hypothetical protein